MIFKQSKFEIKIKKKLKSKLKVNIYSNSIDFKKKFFFLEKDLKNAKCRIHKQNKKPKKKTKI
jgi:hypothetical protein